MPLKQPYAEYLGVASMVQVLSHPPRGLAGNSHRVAERANPYAGEGVSAERRYGQQAAGMGMGSSKPFLDDLQNRDF